LISLQRFLREVDAVIDDPEIPKVGVNPVGSAMACWRVWAPKANRVELILGGGESVQRFGMEPEPRGYFACRTPMPQTGQRYAYSLDGDTPRPDPCSRWQPEGIRGASAVLFPEDFAWDEGTWKGIERKNLVFYELHVGTFTPEGTFDAIIPRIRDLIELGITAIELMPVSQFPGRRSWGYDGVFPFAVQNTYGGPKGLKQLIEECHRLGMAVFLDVIYNHFGPDGNVFPTFGDYLTEKYKTDWGAAINFDDRDSDSVRAVMVENARSWIRDFHFDGLRLDATDRIFDRSPRHILADIAEGVRIEAGGLGRSIHLFAETDLNDAPRYLRPIERGGYQLDGQWNDDFHHAAHVALTGETNGYYIDFAAFPTALAKAYARVFVNDGNYSPFRGRRHGAPAVEFSGDRFVAFTQNHDQVGNRLKGDRLSTLVGPSKLRLAAGILMLAPRIPLIFMGEEYGETNPFPYFCDFESPELIEAVRKGRKAEFAHFEWSEEPLDPEDPATRDMAVLSWSWTKPVRAGLRRLYRDLIRLRRQSQALRDFRHARTRVLDGESSRGVLEVVRGGSLPEASPELRIYFNLTGEERALPPDLNIGAPAFRSESAEYGASGQRTSSPSWLAPDEFVIFGNLSEEVTGLR
jgi:maltooligosyltrehalose trehalohydrolase